MIQSIKCAPSSYKVNSTGIKWIAARLRGKAEEQKHEKWVQVPGMEEFLAKTESETSVAASPCLGVVGSEPAQEVVAEAALEEEKDEEEEENPETHFKQRCKVPHLVLPLGRRLSSHRVGVVELCRLRR